MNTLSSIVAAGAAALGLAGDAVADDRSDAQLRYQQDRAACFTAQFIVDRESCLREAGAALQEARRGTLGSADEREFEQNRLARCTTLPPSDQDDCVRRMSGEGTSSGSVEQGGILREFSRALPVQTN